jgi:hypothetical protein
VPEDRNSSSPFPPQGDGDWADEDASLAPPSRVGTGVGGIGFAAPTHLENPATPATPSPTDTAPSAPQPAVPPSGPEPERLPYPVAWLFPPGAPIPRPYRNAPPRPDRVFWNNPYRW